MANYTAADVKRLRELTGAGMLDSKNALVEADGDFDKAVELLRIKGAKDVGKRAERATAEGLVAAKDGALIELNSETDFVAKNAEFQALADQVVTAAAAAKATATWTRSRLPRSATPRVEQAIADLSRQDRREARAAPGRLLRRHGRDLPAQACRGPAAAPWVCWSSTRPATRTRAEAAHAVALQIAALKAKYLTREDVPEDIVANERRIAEETAKDEGKPEQALPKIVEGRVTGYYKDVVLLDQPSVSGQQEDRQGAARRGRRDRDPLRPVRGRPGLARYPAEPRVTSVTRGSLLSADASLVRAGTVGGMASHPRIRR